jgi:hypothetical protein
MNTDTSPPGVEADHADHGHDAGFLQSDAEFRDLIVPFVEDGIAADDRIVLGYDDRKTGLLRRWLTPSAGLAFVTDGTLYATPARAIATYRTLFQPLRRRRRRQYPDRRRRPARR